jgi:hypothetical protein
MEDEMDVAWMEEKICQFRNVVKKAEGKRPLDKPRYR